ncbi:imidazole glycerol phosphate synthase subunit HisF [Aureispira anguillae]|uniref:Imidazole glycerol phosphate synthase subunit HisF n=1 Tax=Aureispira anguillae TaxID=2864201 RepID=A0A915YF06_9BACT|nr:imidazole glycerol phosphate synthase subunit HisF [Aureispira anguillae]BDS11835.1 imidazole glycerol phosphate synthase subunit HisF [Aureispira anguillae]
MLTKRIIPCLDIKEGRTVKGVNFVGLKDAGDPIELAQLYTKMGADELVFLDITASHEKRKTWIELVEKIARCLSIPFTVGGGISTVEDVARLLRAGADKIAINSAAVRQPQLIRELASKFGSQCVVVAIDAKLENGEWMVYTSGGRIKSEWRLLEWAKKAAELGAGEILFTSMDHDGTKDGFANSILALMSKQLSIPIIASGGAGKKSHFKDVFELGQADAALAASVFHFKEIAIPALKNYLDKNNILVRL